VDHTLCGEFGPFTGWPNEQDAGAPPGASGLYKCPLPFRNEATLLLAPLRRAKFSQLLDQGVADALNAFVAAAGLHIHVHTIPAGSDAP
jgi:hypothetical protein